MFEVRNLVTSLDVENMADVQRAIDAIEGRLVSIEPAGNIPNAMAALFGLRIGCLYRNFYASPVIRTTFSW
jgi:hypothetical protein